VYIFALEVRSVSDPVLSIIGVVAPPEVLDRVAVFVAARMQGVRLAIGRRSSVGFKGQPVNLDRMETFNSSVPVGLAVRPKSAWALSGYVIP